jgi:hypothetical protein
MMIKISTSRRNPLGFFQVVRSSARLTPQTTSLAVVVAGFGPAESSGPRVGVFNNYALADLRLLATQAIIKLSSCYRPEADNFVTAVVLDQRDAYYSSILWHP